LRSERDQLVDDKVVVERADAEVLSLRRLQSQKEFALTRTRADE